MLKRFLFIGSVLSVSVYAQELGTTSARPSVPETSKALLDSPPDESRTLSLSHSSTNKVVLPITVGHSELSTYFSYQHTYRGTDRTYMSLWLRYAKFIADGISLGGAFSLDYEGGNTASMIGAVGSYYFYQNENQAARISLEASKGLTDDTINARLRADVSYEFFPNSNVSFGPYVAFGRIIRDSGSSDYNRLYFGARFSLYF